MSTDCAVKPHPSRRQRRPRLKTTEQILAELESFRKAGFRIVFVVDDNLIGNKKAIKPILSDIVRWQQERGYPLALSTEATLDLAEDEELMQLMGLANFWSVFVGIESPNEASLIETKKLQNVRPKAGTLLERVHRIQSHGLEVWCGMIVGFDHDDRVIFDAIPKFIEDARIGNALIGLLHAIPTTPLYARLKGSGRLNDDEASNRYGTNVVPLLMSREELRDGFVGAMRKAYTLDAYFGRVDALFIGDGFKFAPQQRDYYQISRCRLTPSHQRQGPSAQVEVPAAALAHPSCARRRAAHPLDLRHQDRDALSLCRDHQGARRSGSRRRCHARCHTLLLSRRARQGSGGRRVLGDAGAEEIVDVDDADRAPILHHEQSRDAR
jgi:Domain of unknown function (DUF4070)/Radical SAM superfamily